jgi:hypothetical protein
VEVVVVSATVVEGTSVVDELEDDSEDVVEDVVETVVELEDTTVDFMEVEAEPPVTGVFGVEDGLENIIEYKALEAKNNTIIKTSAKTVKAASLRLNGPFALGLTASSCDMPLLASRLI